MKIATLIVVVLAGCAAPAELTEARDSWDSATYDEVVLRWGTPARSTKLSDGRDVYTWVSDSVGSRGNSSVGFGIGGGRGGGVGIGTGIMFGSGGGESIRCERTLVFKDGRVDDQTWEGPAEYCRSFGRSAR
ncbi:MAG: hypothetical protein E6H42_15200 [Betaproteobacteria bacterium]|nr:MAG: hypothetical protein E6H42_15200 [Betaproteobacteria bacterium]